MIIKIQPKITILYVPRKNFFLQDTVFSEYICEDLSSNYKYLK